MSSATESASPIVLIADDAPGTRLVFASWLRRDGYTVHEVENGQQALDLLATIGFDIAILDVHLPDMSGLEICEYIKSHRATSAIPVLMVSATAIQTSDRSAGLNRGADGYLVEPVQRDELLATTSALLRYHEARRTAERLASRLERLHEGTLLMNAASRLTDLAQLAATGLFTLLGGTSSSISVAVARNGTGFVATVSAEQPDAVIAQHSAADVLELARAAQQQADLTTTTLAQLIDRPWDRATTTEVLTPRGELVGAIALFDASPSAEDALILDAYSAAFAVALENQRLYAVEHQIGLTLQRAMLPATIPQSNVLAIGVQYLAAGEAAEVGGDFYDAVKRDEHTTLVAIGDVAGHSLAAAAIMAELRYSLRAFISLGLTPAETVEQLATTLRTSHPGVTATLCLAEIDTAASQIRICNAGHIPPILKNAGTARTLEDHGPLLGLRHEGLTRTSAHSFEVGDVIVLCTDGLIERRREDIAIGIERLRQAVQDFDEPPTEMCESIVRTVSNSGQVFDDIAILVARHL